MNLILGIVYSTWHKLPLKILKLYESQVKSISVVSKSIYIKQASQNKIKQFLQLQNNRVQITTHSIQIVQSHGI